MPEMGPTYIEIELPATTEEWAEEVIGGGDYDFTTKRTDATLFVRGEIGGNCDAVQIAQSALRDLEEALQEGDISPRDVKLHVWRES